MTCDKDFALGAPSISALLSTLSVAYMHLIILASEWTGSEHYHHRSDLSAAAEVSKRRDFIPSRAQVNAATSSRRSIG